VSDGKESYAQMQLLSLSFTNRSSASGMCIFLGRNQPTQTTNTQYLWCLPFHWLSNFLITASYYVQYNMLIANTHIMNWRNKTIAYVRILSHIFHYMRSRVLRTQI